MDYLPNGPRGELRRKRTHEEFGEGLFLGHDVMFVYISFLLFCQGTGGRLCPFVEKESGCSLD